MELEDPLTPLYRNARNIIKNYLFNKSDKKEKFHEEIQSINKAIKENNKLREITPVKSGYIDEEFFAVFRKRLERFKEQYHEGENINDEAFMDDLKWANDEMTKKKYPSFLSFTLQPYGDFFERYYNAEKKSSGKESKKTKSSPRRAIPGDFDPELDTNPWGTPLSIAGPSPSPRLPPKTQNNRSSDDDDTHSNHSSSSDSISNHSRATHLKSRRPASINYDTDSSPTDDSMYDAPANRGINKKWQKKSTSLKELYKKAGGLGDGEPVAWRDHGNSSSSLIMLYEARGAQTARLEPAQRRPFPRLKETHLPLQSLAKKKLPRNKRTSRAKYRGRDDIRGIGLVAWRVDSEYQKNPTSVLIPMKKAWYPETYVSVRWMSGDWTWESRDGLRFVCGGNPLEVDTMIYQCAVEQEKAYQTAATGKTPKFPRPGTVDNPHWRNRNAPGGALYLVPRSRQKGKGKGALAESELSASDVEPRAESEIELDIESDSGYTSCPATPKSHRHIDVKARKARNFPSLLEKEKHKRREEKGREEEEEEEAQSSKEKKKKLEKEKSKRREMEEEEEEEEDEEEAQSSKEKKKKLEREKSKRREMEEEEDEEEAQSSKEKKKKLEREKSKRREMEEEEDEEEEAQSSKEKKKKLESEKEKKRKGKQRLPTPDDDERGYI